MFLGTQRPYATTVFKCNIQQDVCIGRYRGQLRTEDEVHSFFSSLDRSRPIGNFSEIIVFKLGKRDRKDG